MDISNPHAIISISCNLQQILQEKHIHPRSGAQKAGITVRELHVHDKIFLPHMKPEKAVKIISQLPSGTTVNQSQSVINIPIRRGIGNSSFKGKVPGTYPLLKPKIFSQSPQIQRTILPSQKPQITSSQRVIQSIFLERDQPLNHRPRVHQGPTSEVKSREMTKQHKNCSPPHTLPIYHPPK